MIDVRLKRENLFAYEGSRYMQIVDSGVLAPSFMDFAIATYYAKNTLFYLYQFGHFFCSDEYRICRSFLNQYLFMYVVSGEIYVKVNDREETAGKGQVVLFDCRKAHEYGCRGEAEFWWFHFDGIAAGGYMNYIADKYNTHVMTPESQQRITKYIRNIFHYAQLVVINEHMISLNITKILTHMATSREAIAGTDLFQPVLDFMREHYSEDIKLEDLMDVCRLSKSHFVREFKKHIGSTPHEYLLHLRLRQAKHMLRNGGKTVESIAEECGFNSASHFARAFKKEAGMTPAEFRKCLF